MWLFTFKWTLNKILKNQSLGHMCGGLNGTKNSLNNAFIRIFYTKSPPLYSLCLLSPSQLYMLEEDKPFVISHYF